MIESIMFLSVLIFFKSLYTWKISRIRDDKSVRFDDKFFYTIFIFYSAIICYFLYMRSNMMIKWGEYFKESNNLLNSAIPLVGKSAPF